MTTTPLRAHDLLWVSETPVATDGAPLPDWAITACLQGAPVVVRRAPRGTDGSVPVGLRGGAHFVSCPTCGRTRIDLIGLANRVEAALEHVDKDITVAVMGCVVNGPGEAREADIGVTGGNGEGLIFKKGQIIRKVPEAELLPALMAEIEKL